MEGELKQDFKEFVISEIVEYCHDPIPKKIYKTIVKDEIMFELDEIYELDNIPNTFYFNVKLYFPFKPKSKKWKSTP
jgi:hypothetical protein